MEKKVNWLDQFEEDSAKIDKLVSSGKLSEALQFIHSSALSAQMMIVGHIRKSHMNKDSKS